MENHINHLTLEALAAGERVQNTAALQEHLALCVQCRATIDNLLQEKTEFLKNHPFQSAKKPEVSHRRNNLFAFRMAAAIAVFLVAGLFLKTMSRVDGTRIKGSSAISVYVLGQEGKPEQRKNLVFVPGEKIQFAYSCGPDSEFTLLSMDETGRVTVYYPDSGENSIGLAKGRGLPLSHSIQLDAYIGKELYLAVFSSSRFPVRTVIDSLKQGFSRSRDLRRTNLPAVDGRVTSSIVITKERKE